MIMIKSSWRMLIILLLSSCSFNIINGEDFVQQKVELTPEDESLPQPLPINGQSKQQSNAEAMRYLQYLTNAREESSPIADLVRLYERRMIQLSSRVSDQRKAFNDFRSRKVNAVKPSSEIIERQTIENLETTSGTIYETLMGDPIIERINVDERFSNLAQSLRATINRIKQKIPTIVIKHREAQIAGNVYFNLKNTQNGINLISRLTEVPRNGHVNVVDDLITRQHASPIQINGPVHLIKRSSVNKIDTVTTNGLNLTHIVHRRMRQVHIKSPLRIGSLSSDLVSAQSSMDEANPDNLIFLNSQIPVTISSPCNFNSRVIVTSALNVSTISRVHLPTFKSSALTYNSDQIIGSPIAIRSVETPTVQLRGQLNGLDYNRRVARLLRSDVPISVPRLIIVSQSFRANNLHNVRSLNNQRFPDDFLLANSVQPQTIPVPINFSNLRITREASVKGLINGLKYPDSFVTIDADETINSNLIFLDSVSFNENFTSNNYIGKHRQSDLVDWSHGRHPLMRQLRDSPSGNILVNGDLQVTSLINNLQLNALLNDLVHLAEPNVVQVTGSKIFTNPLYVPSLTIKEINGSPLTNFASSLTPIISSIRFVNFLAINNLIWKSTGKGNRISDLINKRISLVHEGTINGDIFIENMAINSLIVDPLEGHRINNLSPQQLVFSSQNQHINAPLTLRDVTFLRPIWTTKLNIDRTINRRDANRVIRNSVNLQGQKDFKFDRLVLKNCRVNSLIPSSSDGDWRVHNILLVKSLRNLLRKDSDQVIFSPKKFLYPITFASNIKSRSSRGVLHGIQKGPLFLPSELTIKNKLRLSNLVIHGNLKINGKLNGIDLSVPLTDLQDDRKNLYSMISPQSFYSGLKAAKISVNYINGQPFDKYWSKRKPLQFKAPVTIGNLIVDGKINLKGLVNNLPIEKVVNQIRDQQNRQSITIYGDAFFKSPINIINNLNVSGLINSVNFGWLMRSLSELSTIKEITGVKTFKSINIKGNLRVNRLNGQQLNNIVLIHPNKVLFLAIPVEFTSMTTIRSDITSDRLRSHFNSNVNGINMRNLLTNQHQQFKRSSTMAMATLVFTDPVYIHGPPIKIMGKVNSLDLKRDIIWLGDYFQPNQLITGHKSFKRAHFMSNVYVHSTLNGIDWTDRLRRIINPRSTQNITTGVKFAGKMILTSGLFVSMIGNIPASSLIATNQPTKSIIRVPAQWTFNGPSMTIKTDLIVDGRIKNVSIRELIKYSMKKYIPQTINVPLHFDQLILKSVDPVSSMFNNLQSIQRTYSNRWNQVASRLKILDQTVSSNAQISKKLTKYIDSTPMVIKGFQIVQQFPGIIGSTIDLKLTLKLISSTISVGLLVDENVSYTNLIFNGSQFNVQGNYMVTPYIAVHPLQLQQSNYNLYQATPNSTYPSVLINDKKHVIGQLNGRAYDDLQILSINGRDKFISALSSVRGVVETFTFTMVNGQPTIILISTLNVTPNAKKISLFMMINEIYLAVARSSDSDCESDESSSLLFHWLDKQFKLIQQFNHFEATNVVYYQFNGHSYIVFSESKAKVDRLTDKAIHVYQSVFKRWPYCQFNHFHSINFEQTIDLQVITIPSPSRSVQLLAALNSSTLTIWQQKGNAGFARIWSQSLNEGRAFKFFTMESNLYLIVTQLSRQIGSFIMKMIS